MSTTPLFFEDLQVGSEWRTAERRVDAPLIAAFAELSGDDSPIHVQAEAARQAGYPRTVAHGILVTALATGLLAKLGNLRDSSLAIRRLEWEFSEPVLEGEAISCQASVAGKRAVSASAGLVDVELEVLNQEGRCLQRGKLRLVVRRR